VPPAGPPAEGAVGDALNRIAGLRLHRHRGKDYPMLGDLVGDALIRMVGLRPDRPLRR
jgi:hypothetical protein